MDEENFLYKEDGVDEIQAKKISRMAPTVALDEPDPFFLVPVGAITPIPFDNVRVNHLEYSITDGVITPLRAGWYDVFGMFYDTYPNGAWVYNLYILGNGSLELVDTWDGAPTIRMYGRQPVHCNGTTDTISLAISHTANVDRHFNYLVGYQHRSYLNCHCIGTSDSGEF